MKDKFSSNIIYIYLAVTIVIFSFVSTKVSTFMVGIVVPYIEGNKVFIHLGTTIIFFIILIMIWVKNGKKIKLDIIIIFLLIKCVLDLIPAFRSEFDFSSFFGYYLNSIIALIVYFVFRQYTGNYNKLLKLFLMFAVILSLQVVLTAYNNNIQFIDDYYKVKMRIPFAASNIISSVIVAIFFLYSYIKNKSFSVYLCLGILALGIVLTKSRTGLILLIVGIVIGIYKKMNRIKSKNIKIICSIISIAIIVILIIFNDSAINYVMGERIDSTIDLNKLLSGRLDIYVQEIKIGFDNFFLGRGLFYDAYAPTGAHNILIDLFVQSGCIGLINYILALVFIFNKKKYITDKYQMGLYAFMVTMFINSLIEVSYFNYVNDVLFWIIAGLFMGSISKNKDVDEVNNQKIISS